MGTTLYAKNGETFGLNVDEYDTLVWLAWGLQSKCGVYAPLCGRDCRIVARILRHKARLFKLWGIENNAQEAYSLFRYRNKRKDYMNTPRAIQWIRELAAFFEHSNGLITEAEYYKTQRGRNRPDAYPANGKDCPRGGVQ